MQVVERVGTGVGPHEATASDDRRTAFVSLYGRGVAGRQLAVVDAATRSEAGRIDLGDYTRPHGLVQRGGKLFATSETRQSVVRVDPVTRAIDWVGRTGQAGTHMLAVSSDAQRVYTGNIQSNTVSVLEVGEANAIATIPVGNGPEGIALSPDNLEVWAAHRFGGGTSVIDTRTNAVVATIAPGIFSARVAFTPDGTRGVLFDLPSRNVIVIDTLTRLEIARIKTNGVPTGGIVSADSKTLFLSMLSPDALVKIDLETNQIVASVVTGVAPDGLAFVDDSPPPAPIRRRPVQRR